MGAVLLLVLFGSVALERKNQTVVAGDFDFDLGVKSPERRGEKPQSVADSDTIKEGLTSCFAKVYTAVHVNQKSQTNADTVSL